jgi:glycosyltransferase involved in cell wall biosynthesis
MHAEKKCRVLHGGKYYLPHVGGIETHLDSLCGELRKSFDVRVLSAGESRFRTGCSNINGVSITRLATPITIASTPICMGMARAIRSIQPDLLQIHFPNPFAVLAYLLSGYRGPLIITWHSDVVRQRVMNAFLKPLVAQTLKRASAIIATSPNYVRSSPSLRSLGNRLRIIPYGIHNEDYRRRDNAAVENIRRRYGSNIVLGVGRLIYYKGWEYLISAMRQIKGTLLIVGDGPLLADLQRHSEAVGVGGRVRFVGGLQPAQIIPYYHACDVFVLSSIARSEAFGIVQLEAMASGKPVVNTNLDSGVPFVSVDRETGLTVQPNSADGLAKAVNRLLDDRALSNRYGQAGMRRVQQQFTVREMTRATIDLYEEVLGHSFQPPRYAEMASG